MDNSEAYRTELIKSIWDLAEDLIELAPALVGTGDFISTFEIRLKFPFDGAPSIELTREHLSKNWKERKIGG